LGFATIGGCALGWLFIRPSTNILSKVLPHFEEHIIWIISSALVWATIVIFVIWPIFYRQEIVQWIFFVVVVGIAALCGAIGGHQAGAMSLIASSTDYRELARTGGVVTGSTITVIVVASSLVSPTAIEVSSQFSSVFGFVFGVTFLSFFCMFPYMLVITPLSGLLAKAKHFRHHPHLAYITLSAICWMIPGFLIAVNATDFIALGNGLLTTVIGGFCGACGGWAMGVLKYDVVLSNMNLVQE
jgi:hypothetical protein